MWKSGNAPRREAASAPPPPPATRAKRKFEIFTRPKKLARCTTIICHFSARREFDIFTRPKRFKCNKKYKQQVMESKKTCDTFQCKYKVGMKANFQCKYHKTVQEQIQGEKPNLGTFRFSEWLWNTLTTGEPIVNPPLFSPRLPTQPPSSPKSPCPNWDDVVPCDVNCCVDRLEPREEKIQRQQRAKRKRRRKPLHRISSPLSGRPAACTSLAAPVAGRIQGGFMAAVKGRQLWVCVLFSTGGTMMHHKPFKAVCNEYY